MFDFIDTGELKVYIFLVLIPVFILARNYLAKRFFSTWEICYLVPSTILIGVYEGIQFFVLYVAVLLIYVIWWSVEFKKYRDDNPGEYEKYRKFYSDYYGDDLNQDGIKDAFEQWSIAHDPRFFWIFGSRFEKERRKRKRLEDSLNIFTTSAFHSADNKRAKNTKGAYTSQSTRKDYSKKKPEMTEEEKKVAKQHAFAKMHNLRYFAMCETKAEARKLYHKYAVKFHPDNKTTGDKEKFIKIDEEYNRFCNIAEIE